MFIRLLLGYSLCGALLAWGQGAQGRPDLKALYDAHEWFRLREALSASSGPALYKGAVGAAFNQVNEAEAMLKTVVDEGSDAEAEQASEWLSYMFLRMGQYQRAAAQMDENSPTARMVRSLPDQSISKFEPSSVPCRMYQRNLFIPVSMKSKTAEFFIDSDANFSFVSESEARNLGLTVRDNDAQVHGATGNETNFRVAVANELSVGDVQLRNVAFAVLPDTEEVFRRLPLAQQGALGLPVLLAFRTARFDIRQGTFEIGFRSEKVNGTTPTICFDGVNPITLIEFQRQWLPVVLDTGAETTEIWPPFAKRFADMVDSGKLVSQLENGFAGRASISAKVVPELRFAVGGFDVHMRAAHVLLARTTADSQWYYARLGLDVLSQAREVTIDFESLTLTLQ